MAKEPPAEILTFLVSIGAESVSHHAGRTLSCHLVSTHDILRAWNEPESVCIAGLCHSIYGTDAFNTSCLGPDDRDRVKAVIGEAAERLSYLFGAMRRDNFQAKPGSLKLESRFDATALEITPFERSALCNILLANEMDLLWAKKGRGCPDKLIKKVGPVFESLKPWLSSAARTAYHDAFANVPANEN